MSCSTRRRWLAALEVWSQDRSRPLSDLLRESGVDEQAIRRIEEAVGRELERHGQDPTETLAQLESTSGLVARLDSAVGRESDQDRGGPETVLPDAPIGPPCSSAGPDAGGGDPLATIDGPLATFDPSAYHAAVGRQPASERRARRRAGEPALGRPGHRVGVRHGLGADARPEPGLVVRAAVGPAGVGRPGLGPGGGPVRPARDLRLRGPAASGLRILRPRATRARSGRRSSTPTRPSMGPDPGAGLLQTQAEDVRTEVMGGARPPPPTSACSRPARRAGSGSSGRTPRGGSARSWSPSTRSSAARSP